MMNNDKTTEQTQSITPTAPKRDESAVGGYYHGPSNQAGMTDREYWDAMDRWEDERYDRRYNW